MSKTQKKGWPGGLREQEISIEEIQLGDTGE